MFRIAFGLFGIAVSLAGPIIFVAAGASPFSDVALGFSGGICFTTAIQSMFRRK